MQEMNKRMGNKQTMDGQAYRYPVRNKSTSSHFDNNDTISMLN